MTGILILCCAVIGIYLYSLNNTLYSLPDESIDNIVKILDSANISIDRALIAEKKVLGTVYVCDSTEYTTTVSKLLGGHKVKYSFTVPNGEILFLENGSRFEFGTNFSFSYSLNGEVTSIPDIYEISNLSAHVNDAKKGKIASVVTRFLDQGNREFEDSDIIHIETSIDNVWEHNGLYYALCTRTIDGAEITGNLVICVVSGNEVVEAYGNWCFLTLSESYSSQLTDMLNILFNVKNEITSATLAGNLPSRTTIQSIDLCYTLYFYGNEESFCLIPCWKIVTDMHEDFIYNAINGELYTN